MPASPHGGRLIDRQVEGAGGAKLAAEAARRPAIVLNDREQCDLEMIGNGAMSPLEGFMGSSEYGSVLAGMRLPSGPVWSLPVTLSLKDDSPAVSAGDEITLVDQAGSVRGTMEVGEVFEADLEAEASSSLGTTDPAHPGVAYLKTLTGRYVGGRIMSVRNRSAEPFAERRLDPRETRVLFKTMGWNTIAAFQTRNPVHRAHEYIQKCALETVDGLMLHPLVGMTKDDDIPAGTRMECYEVLLDNYFPRGRVVMSVFPAAMRYAGPKEAVFHALLRKNYGCTHFIVGRDHAGVGSYYGTYDAQRIFDGFDQSDLGVVPLKFEHAFYCRKCGGMASPKTCPHGDSEHVTLSGRRVREMLAAGEIPPGEFTREEVARVLVEWASGRGESR
jgi:sulfate adenylyltransferase